MGSAVGESRSVGLLAFPPFIGQRWRWRWFWCGVCVTTRRSPNTGQSLDQQQRRRNVSSALSLSSNTLPVLWLFLFYTTSKMPAWNRNPTCFVCVCVSVTISQSISFRRCRSDIVGSFSFLTMARPDIQKGLLFRDNRQPPDLLLPVQHRLSLPGKYSWIPVIVYMQIISFFDINWPNSNRIYLRYFCDILVCYWRYVCTNYSNRVIEKDSIYN